MSKRLIQEWLPWILFFILALVMWLSMTGCYKHDPNQENMGVKYEDGAKYGKPAKNKPVFVDRASYRTEEDFLKALCKKVAWLEEKGHEVTLIRPIYGKSVIQKGSIKRFAIYYKVSHKKKEKGKETYEQWVDRMAGFPEKKEAKE